MFGIITTIVLLIDCSTLSLLGVCSRTLITQGIPFTGHGEPLRFCFVVLVLEWFGRFSATLLFLIVLCDASFPLVFFIPVANVCLSFWDISSCICCFECRCPCVLLFVVDRS